MPSKADIRALKRVLESGDVASALTAYLSRFKAKRKAPSAHAVAKKQKRLGRKEAVAAVRPLVEARAAGRCECGCGVAFADSGDWRAEWDEFFGRKRVSVQETWMLASYHHRCKTENYPTRAWWDDLFREHCRKYNYPFRPRLVKAARSAPKERGVTNG